jgi:hypothetical protein
MINGGLLYFLIGRVSNNTIISEYPYDIDEKVLKNSRILLSKLNKIKYYDKYEERNVIEVEDGVYYYTVTSAKLLFFSKSITRYK